jgi:hypothetical protein
MLNDDDFPALPNSMGQTSQQQVCTFLLSHLTTHKTLKKSILGASSISDDLKRKHHLASDSNDKAGIQTHPDGISIKFNFMEILHN